MCLIKVSIILFYIDLKRRNSPSARCASASNAISRHIGASNGTVFPITNLFDIDILPSKLDKSHKL